MLGYTGGPRKGILINPATTGAEVNSGSQDSYEFGLQSRLLFGSECCFRPFLYFNAVKTVGAPISILFGRVLGPFDRTTKLNFTTNWIARLGIGANTPWLYEKFQLGGGVAAALFNQTVDTYLGEFTTVTSSQTSNAIRPSFMGNVTWELCPHCLFGHEGLLTAEVTADDQPLVKNTVPSEVGPLDTHVNQSWVFRGDLIFSIRLF